MSADGTAGRPGNLTCHFLSGDALRRRRVSPTVLTTLLDIPAPPAKVSADWAREITLHLQLRAGDVEALPWGRTRARWQAHPQCLQAAASWAQKLGLREVLAESDMALMACRGARYHHDAGQYGGSAFCNLFLTDDQGLDLHFPASGQRIALTRGTAVIFDTGQPHAVVRRGSHHFSPVDFESDPTCTQVFMTWELPIENPDVARTLGLAFFEDIEAWPSLDGVLASGHALRRNGEPVDVCPDSGLWHPAARSHGKQHGE